MKKLDSSACAYGAKLLNQHVKSLKKEMENAIDATDIEHVHQTRVFTRRIRSTIPIFQDCFPKKKLPVWISGIKKVTGSLGNVRDTDVQIEFISKFYTSVELKEEKSGIHRLMLRLNQKRDQLQKKVVKSVKTFKDSNILDELSIEIKKLIEKEEDKPQNFSRDLYLLANLTIMERLDEFFLNEEHIEYPEKINELHEMRIHAKQLRYTMEIFAPLFMSKLEPAMSAIKGAQELLGKIHDLDVWQEIIPKFIEEERERTIEFYGHSGPFNLLLPGINHLQNHCLSRREKIYQDFVKEWHKWKEEQVWLQLMESIRIPTFPTDAVIHEINHEDRIETEEENPLESESLEELNNNIDEMNSNNASQTNSSPVDGE